MQNHDTPEVWRPVVGHDDMYEVSDQGRVRSLDRWIRGCYGTRRLVRGQLKVARPGYGGYVRVELYRDNRPRKVRVHTLVLEAFVGPAPVGLECRHVNGDPADNRLTNLRWGTSSQNKWDIVRHGRHHAPKRSHCPRSHPLVAPNIVPFAANKGQRACLACKRAGDNARYYWRQGRYFDFEAAADRHYAAIMRQADVA